MKATTRGGVSSVKKKVISVTKKAVPKKKSQKKSVFLKVSTTKDKLDSKLQTITNLHTKQKAVADSSVELLPKSFFDTALQLKPKLEIAMLSPYRFPVAVDSQKIAVGIARYGGVLFVLLGAVATMFFSQALSVSPTGQLALLPTSTTQTESTVASQTPINCADPLQYASLTCSTSVDKTPDAQFELTGDTAALSGSVRVGLKAPYAKKVALSVRSESTGQFTDLGLMTSVTTNVFESYIDTNRLQDGSYNLRALVTNFYGTYEVLHTSRITIHNVELTSEQNTATSTEESDEDVTTISEISVAATAPKIAVLTAIAPSEFRFTIEAEEADAVKLYATQLSTKKEMFVGTAYLAAPQVWKYRWNASDFADGDYAVRAQVITGGVPTVSNTVRITKKPLEGAILESATPVASPVLTETKPEVTIDVQSNLPLTGSAGLKIDVASANKIEVFAVKDGELSERYLGTAKLVDSDTWVFYVDTKSIPNGMYRFVTRVSNKFGTYDKSTPSMKIANALPVLTQNQESNVEAIKQIDTEVVSTLALAPKIVSMIEDESASDTTVSIPVEPKTTAGELPDQNDFATIEKLINERLKQLAVAVRFGDAEAIKKIQEENESSVTLHTPEDEASYALLKSKMAAYLKDATTKVEERVAATNALFEERTKEKATKDSDKDGIADYDEVTLFKTNPYAADSDSDGFVDSAEIEGGFNPNDSSSEALIVYESPKEAGIEREQTLAVASITTAPVETGAEKTEPVAIISGTGLPNSYVSLYIFSTPVVVSVKTDAEGSWVYRFDKELDNGEHEVYVAVTDNAGKIVAKSKPFAFVKEAEAFSGVTNPNQIAQVPVPVVHESTFMSRYMIYMVLSISVVAIGLVLILLGLHLESRARVLRGSKITEEKVA